MIALAREAHQSPPYGGLVEAGAVCPSPAPPGKEFQQTALRPGRKTDEPSRSLRSRPGLTRKGVRGSHRSTPVWPRLSFSVFKKGCLASEVRQAEGKAAVGRAAPQCGHVGNADRVVRAGR